MWTEYVLHLALVVWLLLGWFVERNGEEVAEHPLCFLHGMWEFRLTLTHAYSIQFNRDCITWAEGDSPGYRGTDLVCGECSHCERWDAAVDEAEAKAAAYDVGRDLAHWLTFRRFEQGF